MYCSNCGQAIKANAKFCGACGQAVGVGATSASAATEATAAPAKKKMARWKKVVIGVAGFIVVAIAAAMFLTSGLVDPIDRHIAALQHGDIDGAYAETSVAFRDATSRDQFAAFINSNPSLTRIADHTFTERAWENNLGTVKGTLTTTDGGVVPVEYRLVKENDAWRIMGINLGAP